MGPSFNKDETLVGVITVFPDGLSLDDYPTLRKTLSQLPPAREFYLTSSQLLEGQVPIQPRCTAPEKPIRPINIIFGIGQDKTTN